MTEDKPAVRVGLTLPSFQSDPQRVLEVARAAEDAGLDGVFLFDHLFRRRGDAADAERRPALELLTMTAAVAAETRRLAVGTLVARATLRPPASLRAGFDTLARIAPGRIIAGLGGGDDESVAEDAAFGVLPADPEPAGTEDVGPQEFGAYRVDRLDATVATMAGREYPVWVAGRSPAALRLAAARADGWNHWGSEPARFAAAADRLRAEITKAGRNPDAFTYTWGGLAVLAATPDETRAKAERLNGNRPGIVVGDPPRAAEQIAAYADAGAGWVILGPIDSANPDNAALLGAARTELNAARR
jgi:alkanesulfonate monooxygenase SsuD/methylene tetrahydromethanopterin reductase-like flavin-dependent oxidoreductase (luciferase family)